MKRIALETIAYRAHTPKWAHAPTSGSGAATHGGRVNRIGVPALYLSLDAHTALAEYQQTSPLMPPATLVTYRIHLEPIVDFSTSLEDSLDSIWEDFYCDWRSLWFDQAIEPPSWLIGDLVIAAGAKGILYQSTLTGMPNLVVYTETLSTGDILVAYDPHGDLPSNAKSWQEGRP